jgi:hypothetical protein
MSRVRNTASSGNKGGFTLFLHALARHEIEGDGQVGPWVSVPM